MPTRSVLGRMVTKADDAAGDELFSESLYTPYGRAVEFPMQVGAEEDHSTIGERRDRTTGMMYLNARYYDPEIGLFLSPDWFEVTEAGVGTNRYAYAGGDPVNGRDPGGNVVEDPTGELKDEEAQEPDEADQADVEEITGSEEPLQERHTWFLGTTIKCACANYVGKTPKFGGGGGGFGGPSSIGGPTQPPNEVMEPLPNGARSRGLAQGVTSGRMQMKASRGTPVKTIGGKTPGRKSFSSGLEIQGLFKGGRTPKASSLREWARSKGWTSRKSRTGPEKFFD